MAADNVHAATRVALPTISPAISSSPVHQKIVRIYLHESKPRVLRNFKMITIFDVLSVFLHNSLKCPTDFAIATTVADPARH